MPGTTPRESHYAVKCSVDDKSFPECNGTEVELLNTMGKTANATNELKEIIPSLIPVLGSLNQPLFDMKTETKSKCGTRWGKHGIEAINKTKEVVMRRKWPVDVLP